MIDPRHIRENIDLLKELLIKRNMAGAVNLDLLSSIENERRENINRSDELREKRNRLSKEIGIKKSKGEDAADLMKEVQGIGDSIKECSEKLNDLNEQYTDMHLSIPNLLDESVPTGKDDSENKAGEDF